MGVVIGGRHIVTAATTIPTRGHIVARITGATGIIIQPPTMIPPQELMAGNRRPMALTGRQQEVPATILTPALMPEALRSRHLMGAEAQPRRIIRTPEPMLRPDRARIRTRSGAAPMSREETRVLPWVITPPPMEQWQAPLIRREEKWPLPVRSGETPLLAKPPAEICMPDTMATF